jgi:myo-inositol-1(or 4)-monophosphatase
VDPAQLLEVGNAVASAVRQGLDGLEDLGLAGTRPWQYRSDLVADEAAVNVLLDAGLGVLSEESGLHEADRELLAVLDPLDGSTNASRGLPRFATSVAFLDGDGPLAAVVVDQARGVRYEAVRGMGATRDGAAIKPSSCTSLGAALIGLSGFPPRHLGWRQYRVLGAAALDLCAVAEGSLDAYADVTLVRGAGVHWPWDYLGGLLVCSEAGASVADAEGRDLVVRIAEGRTPVGAATPALLEQLLSAIGAVPQARDAGPAGSVRE